VRKIYLLFPVAALAAMIAIVTARAYRSGGIEARRDDAGRVVETGSLFRFADDGPARVEAAPAPALSLTASDGTGLKLAVLDARGVIDGPLAFTEVRLAFDNPEARTLEGTFRITLPQGAAISRFAMRQGERWQEGEVVEKQAARQAYEDFLHRRQDPALLEQAAGNEFSARVFPIPPSGRKELIVSYSQELGPDAPYALSLRGLPQVQKLDAVVSRAGDDAPILGQIHLENAVPDRDLAVEPSKLRPGDGLRAGELVLLRVQPAAAAGADPVGSTIVLVDTSASRALGFGSQVELVDRVVAGLDPTTPLLVAAFDQGIDTVHEGPASGWAGAGATRLRQRQALGASDLAGALAWARAHARAARATRVVLVTDGVPTVGATDPTALRAAAKALGAEGVQRLDAVAVGGIRDDALLRGLATAGLARDGVVIDGARGPALALRRLSYATRSVAVKVEGATWQWPQRLDGVQPGDEALIYAEVPLGTAPRLRVGDAAAVEPKLAEIDRPLLERAWVQARIAALVATPAAEGGEAAAKAEIVRLSTTYRVLSPHTALLVLETEADYARYKIDRKALADILTVEGTKLARLKRSEDQPFAPPTNPVVDTKPRPSDGVVLRAPPPPPAVQTPAQANAAAPGGAPAAEGRRREAMDAPAPPPAATAAAAASAAPVPADVDLAPAPADAAEAPASPRPQAAAAAPQAASRMAAPRALGVDSFRDEPLGLLGQGAGGQARGGDVGGLAGPSGVGGIGAGQGFGSGHGRLGGSHRSRPPRVSMGATQVSGRLPPEVIQRIVRQNFGRFRLCYENGLRNNPNLQGRVSARFVIGRDGAVSTVNNGGSDLPDAGVVSCVLRAFNGLSFPQPEGGVVTVTFPILFAPEGGAPTAPSSPAPPPSPAPAPERPLPAPRSAAGPYSGPLAEVMDALRTGDHDGALTKAVAFWKASPGDVLAFVALGEAFEARAEVRSAARAYGSIIDLFASRADLRRMAGERLERLGPAYALSLAADSYAKAVEERPDHPAGHRLLAYARLRSGDPAGAFAAIEKGALRSYPAGRFAGVDQILREDVGLLGAAWIKADGSKREEVERRVAAVGGRLPTEPSLRFVLVWETDNNDVDFHIHDAKGGHAFYGQKQLASGGALYADVTTGYGPECFTVPLPVERRAAPYHLQAHYYSRGPMGYGMGKLEIVDHDGQGGLTFEERPFVVMQDRAFVELGFYPAAKPGAEPGVTPPSP
jgi:hypothetical protein